MPNLILWNLDDWLDGCWCRSERELLMGTGMAQPIPEFWNWEQEWKGYSQDLETGMKKSFPIFGNGNGISGKGREQEFPLTHAAKTRISLKSGCDLCAQCTELDSMQTQLDSIECIAPRSTCVCHTEIWKLRLAYWCHSKQQPSKTWVCIKQIALEFIDLYVFCELCVGCIKLNELLSVILQL